jgi:hypothetical protein
MYIGTHWDDIEIEEVRGWGVTTQLGRMMAGEVEVARARQ